MGWAWSLAQPAAMLLFFSILFATIFPLPEIPMGSGNGSSYPAFLFCGMVVWNLFSATQNLSITTLRSCRPLLGKVAFPAWTAVVGAQLVQLIQVLSEFAVLLLLLLLLGNMGWSWLAAVPVLIGAILFTQGVGLVVSVLGTRFRDVRAVVAIVLGLLYFATPILYPMSALDGMNHWLMLAIKLNPLSWYVQGMHDALYYLDAPSPLALLLLLLGGAGTFLLGRWAFTRLSTDLAENL